MQKLFGYLLNQNLTVVYSPNTSTENRNRTVYSRPLKTYRGIKNPLQMQLKDSDQKPVDITGKTFVFNILNPSSHILMLSKQGTIENAKQGKVNFILTDNDLRNIDANMYTYSVYEVEGGDSISMIKVTDRGSGYTGEPSVTITGGSPSIAAEATAQIYNSVEEINFAAENSSRGSGYTPTPIVTISSSVGTGAKAVAVIDTTDANIGEIIVTDKGTGYTSASDINVTISGGGGTGATFSVTTDSYNRISDIAVNNGGSGFSAPDIDIMGGGGTDAAARATVNNAGEISDIIITNSGSGYTSKPSVTIREGSNSSAMASVATEIGSLRLIEITNGGSGYESVPSITIGGRGARAKAILNTSGGVASINVENGGSGYSSMNTPNISFTRASGSGWMQLQRQQWCMVQLLKLILAIVARATLLFLW